MVMPEWENLEKIENLEDVMQKLTQNIEVGTPPLNDPATLAKDPTAIALLAHFRRFISLITQSDDPRMTTNDCIKTLNNSIIAGTEAANQLASIMVSICETIEKQGKETF